ncbi:MAG: TonB C-terminal domain-containing protein [Deltaproteobacteria bacterium]|nr:TonB C-terminal domain-containing protein [Candidatus Zymogenaceae bacterium]
MRNRRIISSLDRPRRGVYVTICISALIHVALFVLLGIYMTRDNDVSLYGAPYTVSLVPDDVAGEGGEDGVPDVEEVIDKTVDPAVGGPEEASAPSKDEGLVMKEKEKESPPAEKKEETPKEKEEVKETVAKPPEPKEEPPSYEAEEKESTADLDSAIESIRKNVELKEEEKRREVEEKERERLAKEEAERATREAEDKTTPASPAGGGVGPGGGTPAGERTPAPGTPGGGSPFGSDNIYASGPTGGVPDMEFSAYYNDIWKRIRSMWSVPEDLLDQELETVLGIRIARDGTIVDVWMEESSGNSYYDDTALRAIRKANPLAPLPEKYTGASMDVGIRFNAN